MNRSSILFVLLLVPALSGCTGEDANEPAPFAPPPHGALLEVMEGLHEAPELRFVTDHGRIRVLLYTAMMPATTAHIGGLAADGLYDDTIVHRVVDDFVIQGGDPTGTGVGGSGQTVPFERHEALLFGAGAVGLARDTDPDSGDSQWFVTEWPAPHLSDANRSSAGALFGEFALFGQVVDGMDVVREIAAVPVVPGLDRPIEDVVVEQATLLAPPTDIDLLHLPPTLRLHDGMPSWILQRPLFLVADHAFPVTVFHRPSEDRPAPASLQVQYRMTDPERGEMKVEQTLVPHPDDPSVYTGTVTLPGPGRWQEQVTLGGGSQEVDVVAWHDDYTRYLPAAGDA